MEASRHAQRLMAPVLALGLALGLTLGSGTTARAFAPEGAAKRPVSTKTEGEAEPEGEAKPGGEAKPEGEAEGEAEPGGEASPAGEAEPGGEASPAGEAEPEGEVSPEGEGEAEPEGGSGKVVTVRPAPVTSFSPLDEPVGDTPSREVVEDPRRRFSDERILVRAGLLAFGVAGLALAPTVVGLHQRAHARRVLGRLETPSEADARPEVERYERTMTTLAIISGAVSVSSLIAGAVLVGVGLSRRDAPRRTTVAPAVGAGTAGLTLRGRF